VLISEAGHEVTLRRERPVVEGRGAGRAGAAGQADRAGEETVSGEVRKEQIEAGAEGDPGIQR
jgi:hypothetical protein